VLQRIHDQEALLCCNVFMTKKCCRAAHSQASDAPNLRTENRGHSTTVRQVIDPFLSMIVLSPSNSHPYWCKLLSLVESLSALPTATPVGARCYL
jgi:hypothetical protein